MSEEKLGMFDDEPEVVETPEITPEAAPGAPAPVETGEKEEASPPPGEAERAEQKAPLTALLDEREKRQKAEREAEELRRWRAEREAKEREAASNQPKPDFFEDPDAAVQRHVEAVRISQSRFFAEREFGAEAVKEMMDFYDRNPQKTQEFLRHPSPFHAAMDAYRRDKFLEEVGSDPEKWREAERARIREELLRAPAPSSPTPPPASMARAPSAGRSEPVVVQAPPNLAGLFNG